MKPPDYLITLFFFFTLFYQNIEAQSLDIDGDAIIGKPGQGNNILELRSERSWIFRQYDTGSNTALELYSTIGLKNFLVNTTGAMGIGVLIPLEKLHVNGNIKADGPKISFGTSEYINDAGSFLIECNGTLVSTLDNTDFLGTSGRRWNTVYAVNGMINTSDARQKKNIQQLPYGIVQLMKLRPVTFNWIDGPPHGTKLGLIGQEVQQVIPEVVVDHEYFRNEESGEWESRTAKYLGICYSDLIPVLINAIQEQQRIIEEKEKRLVQLEIECQKIKMLEKRLDALENP